MTPLARPGATVFLTISDTPLSPFPSGSSLHLPVSVEFISESCFSGCESLGSIGFDSKSLFLLPEERTLSPKCLRSLHLLASVEFISESCFCGCETLICIPVDSNSRLSRVEKDAFS
jgi:hypothetical protein